MAVGWVVTVVKVGRVALVGAATQQQRQGPVSMCYILTSQQERGHKHNLCGAVVEDQ